MQRMSRAIAMARERIRMSRSMRYGVVSDEEVTAIIVGMIRQIHTAIIKDDMVFVRVLSNMTFFLS